MDLQHYTLETDPNHRVYKFQSVGPNGTIRKVVSYKQLREWNFKTFNLGFGDWDEEKQKINDRVTSNNKDHEKVLATVAATILDFTKYYPNSIVYAAGVTASRTRLYQIGITKKWEVINKLFDVSGLKQGIWESFEIGRNYEAFMVRAKEKL